jgi:hypothetical protein
VTPEVKQMPQQGSNQHLSTVRTPPSALPEPAKRIWRTVVETRPANSITLDDVPLLQEYCLTKGIFLPELDALIAAAGITGRELRTRDALARRSAWLAERLRLSNFQETHVHPQRYAGDVDGLLVLRDCDV